MALKTTTKIADAVPAEAPTMVLELALYTNYTRDTNTFVKGEKYKFKADQAMALLQEADHGRPIWRVYREPAKPKVQQGPVDVTKMVVTPIIDPIPGSVPENRIDIGDESELGLPTEEDVTI